MHQNHTEHHINTLITEHIELPQGITVITVVRPAKQNCVTDTFRIIQLQRAGIFPIQQEHEGKETHGIMIRRLDSDKVELVIKLPVDIFYPWLADCAGDGVM